MRWDICIIAGICSISRWGGSNCCGRMGCSYAELEREGVFFVVVKVAVNYKSPARYDDELTLTTRIERQTPVRIDHVYELKKGKTLVAEGSTTIACVGRDGQLMAIPELLRGDGEG